MKKFFSEGSCLALPEMSYCMLVLLNLVKRIGEVWRNFIKSSGEKKIIIFQYSMPSCASKANKAHTLYAFKINAYGFTLTEMNGNHGEICLFNACTRYG